MYEQLSSLIKTEEKLCLCSDLKQLSSMGCLHSLNLKKQRSKFKIFNKFVLTIIYFYQHTLSYFFGGKCRFYPSCSHYALESYKQFNFIKSTQLVLIRLSKCHPFSKKSGYDPLPLVEESLKYE